MLVLYLIEGVKPWVYLCDLFKIYIVLFQMTGTTLLLSMKYLEMVEEVRLMMKQVPSLN